MSQISTLSECLFLDSLDVWLSVSGLCLLDSASCNTLSRPDFLNCLKSVVLPEDACDVFNKNSKTAQSFTSFIAWLGLKGAKLKRLEIKNIKGIPWSSLDVSRVTTFQFDGSQTYSLESIDVILGILNKCTQLTEVVFHDVNFLTVDFLNKVDDSIFKNLSILVIKEQRFGSFNAGAVDKFASLCSNLEVIEVTVVRYHNFSEESFFTLFANNPKLVEISIAFLCAFCPEENTPLFSCGWGGRLANCCPKLDFLLLDNTADISLSNVSSVMSVCISMQQLIITNRLFDASCIYQAVKYSADYSGKRIETDGILNVTAMDFKKLYQSVHGLTRITINNNAESLSQSVFEAIVSNHSQSLRSVITDGSVADSNYLGFKHLICNCPQLSSFTVSGSDIEGEKLVEMFNGDHSVTDITLMDLEQVTEDDVCDLLHHIPHLNSLKLCLEDVDVNAVYAYMDECKMNVAVYSANRKRMN